MNAIIFAGGRGSRLQGIWEKPKCLVPVAGREILLRLLDQLVPLNPGQVVLALGCRADGVHGWMKGARHSLFGRCVLHTESDTNLLGTAGALRACAPRLQAAEPLLAINGDTLPLNYSLQNLVSESCRGQFPSLAAWSREAYAGAACLSREIVSKVIMNSSKSDLDHFLQTIPRFTPCTFLDVGTPEGFATAQTLKLEGA